MKKSKLFLTPVLKCLLVVAISAGVILFNILL